MELDIEKMITISTAHMSSDTYKLFATFDQGVVVYDYTYGWMVLVPNPEEEIGLVTENLLSCIEFARKHDCKWLRFDQDGDILDELPVYEWII